ncbi:MAG: DUF3995 domain-containing protein [Cyclobacteriaceae bacterium]
MMLIAMAWAQSLIFAVLSLIHLNWGFGGSWGFDKSLPTNVEGERVLNPKSRDSMIVGIGLMFFSLFYMVKADIVFMDLPSLVESAVGWLIPIVFLLRAMGDFKYIGFFKKLTSTDFASRDTRLYSPLCLFIGINGVLITLNIS